MALDSMKQIFERMERDNLAFWEVVLADDMEERQVSREASMAKMLSTWQAMQDAADAYTGRKRSVSGLVGGDGMKMRQYNFRGCAMTGGYVSALPREINISGKPISMFQTDAAINAGNSGGPLFDMAGNVIGITSAKISGITGSGASIEGVGFAIPINEALRVVYDLQEYGYVRGRAFLGVTVKELDAATADTYGLPVGPIVQSVVADSCADKAGIAVKDIILAFKERNVKTYTQLMSALNKCSAGDVVTLRIYRAGAELDVTLTLDERPEEQTVRKVEQGDVDNTEEYSYYYDPDKGE